MKIATALLDRLVPGRGGEADAETTENSNEEDTTAAATAADAPEPGTPSEPKPVSSNRIADEDVSPEALVLRKLIAHGGRVRRSTLAEETGWDDRKVGDVLEGMEADAQISMIRRRDPLVCRRGFEPAGAPLRFKSD